MYIAQAVLRLIHFQHFVILRQFDASTPFMGNILSRLIDIFYVFIFTGLLFEI